MYAQGICSCQLIPGPTPLGRVMITVAVVQILLAGVQEGFSDAV
jgi:hypothetical protein